MEKINIQDLRLDTFNFKIESKIFPIDLSEFDSLSEDFKNYLQSIKEKFQKPIALVFAPKHEKIYELTDKISGINNVTAIPILKIFKDRKTDREFWTGVIKNTAVTELYICRLNENASITEQKLRKAAHDSFGIQHIKHVNWYGDINL